MTRPPGPPPPGGATTRPSAHWLPPGAHPPERMVWVNGQMMKSSQASLSLFDRGARDGGGLFETLRIYGGRPFDWSRHMERLVLGAALLGFPVPSAPSRLRQALAQLLAAEGLADAVARLTVTRGVAGGRPTRTGAWAEVEPVPGRLWAGTRRGAAAVAISKRPFHPGPLGAFKTTSRLAYDLAREEARAAGVDEILLAGSDGMLYEGAASNLFVVRGGEVLTPPLALGILPGIVRTRVFECCRALGVTAREEPLRRPDLERADEIFLTNSVQEIVPVERCCDRPLPGRALGERLLAAYRERVAAGTD